MPNAASIEAPPDSTKGVSAEKLMRSPMFDRTARVVWLTQLSSIAKASRTSTERTGSPGPTRNPPGLAAKADAATIHMGRCYIASIMLVWVAITGLAFANEPDSATPADSALGAEPAEEVSEWGVPVRFRPMEPAFDRSRGLPLPRNGRLNPTVRNGAVVVAIGAAAVATYAGSLALGQLALDPFPRNSRSDPQPVVRF